MPASAPGEGRRPNRLERAFRGGRWPGSKVNPELGSPMEGVREPKTELSV